MGTIKEIKALGVGFVGFYEGKREAYQADSYVDKLYFASDTGELLFNSKSYSVIVDDLLTSDSTIHALSANQGKQLKSLIDNIDSNNGCWNFEFNFFHPLIEYEIEGPWCSALGQGQGISLMCRLYSIDQKEVYKE